LQKGAKYNEFKLEQVEHGTYAAHDF